MSFIRIRDLRKTFEKKERYVLTGRKKTKVHAVHGLNLELKKGEIFGVIGESGCGKTTLARLLMRLEKESSGEISYNGVDLCKLSEKEIRVYRKHMQMIFQDPYDTLNPGMSIQEILMEPLNAHESLLSFEEKKKKAELALESIELMPAREFMDRYPHQLSGGQRQRLAIARALIVQPSFVVADEPTSMLDVSIRAGILNLLKSMKDQMGLTILFITHDLATAGYMCDRLAVMYKGEVVETGDTRKIIENPLHPYTQALIAVVADLSQFLAGRQQYILDQEDGSGTWPQGCLFVERCPYQIELCHQSKPESCEMGKDHFVSCHLYDGKEVVR